MGIKNGLKLILDLHSDQESFGTVQSDWSGFQVRSRMMIFTPEIEFRLQRAEIDRFGKASK